LKNPVSLFSFRSPRHQRGFLRVSGAILSLGLVGVGGLTVQQVKAYHHTPAKHPVTAAKSFAKGCGCGSVASGKHQHTSLARNASYGQDASDMSDGTDNYEQAVSLKAGQRLSLGVSDPSGSIQPGGIWTPEFGTVDANGTYTAPSFTPPEGLDYVQYTDASGNDVFINVRIMPNPDIPNSDKTPTVTFDYTAGNSPDQSSDQSAQPAQAQGAQSAQPAQAQGAQSAQPVDAATPDGLFAPGSKTIVVLPGETPAPPEQINSTTSLVGEVINGVNVLVLPAHTGGDGTTSAVYAQPLDETPQQVTLLPNVSPPSGPCTDGYIKSVYTPYTTTNTVDKALTDLADITVDAGIAADALKLFNVKLNVKGVYHVKAQIYHWKHTRIQYRHGCSKGRWILLNTFHCDGFGTGMITFPAWAATVEGSPKDGTPRIYTPDACHP